jgi:heat shock protein HtpX
MNSIYSHQSANVAKTYFLMAIFFAFIVLIGYFVSSYYGAPELLYIAVFLSLFMNILSYWFSDKIVLSIAGARQAKREEFFDLYNLTENLAITAGLPMPKVYVIEDPAPNAFATGRNKEHAVVAVTTGLLARLEKNELEGVIAHELSHIGNRDILLMSVVVVLVGLVSILSDALLRGMAFGRDRENNKSGGILAIVGLVLIILSPIIATLIKLAISRKREFLADASAALLTRYPEGLAGALEKISTYNAPLKDAHTATAHLFIANPFGNKGAAVSSLFATHPPVAERIKALRSMI